MSDKAFEALATYDWGTDPKVLSPIDEAVVATHGDTAARAKLEKQLADVLTSEAPHAAKDYACRQLRTIGTDASVPMLAELLGSNDVSHMARYALQQNPSPAAANALRKAVPQLRGEQKVGVIASLGACGDEASVEQLAEALNDEDVQVARAAAKALGAIGTAAAAKALADASVGEEVFPAATDASLACAENFVADGNKSEALVIYKRIATLNVPKHVRLAATKGMLAAAK